MSSEITEAVASTPEENVVTTEATTVEPVVVADVVADSSGELETLKQEKEAAESAMMMKTTENEKMKKDLEDLKKVVESYMAKEAEMKKNAMMMQRKASLIELGIENETAEAAVQKLEHLDDNTFAVMTSLFANSFEAFAKKKSKKEEDKEEATQNEVAAKVEEETKDEEKNEDEKKESPKNAELGKKTKSSVDAEALDTAEVEDSVNLSVGGQVESVVETTRAALVEFISNRLGKKL